MKIVIGLLIALSFLFTGCSPGTSTENENKEGDPEKTSSQQEVPPPSLSAELKAAQMISGVYTGTADVDYSILGSIKSVLDPDANLKISINHSGDNDNKKVVVYVESEDGKESFCTIFNKISTMNDSGPETYEVRQSKRVGRKYITITSDEKISKGKIGDATHVLRLSFLTGKKVKEQKQNQQTAHDKAMEPKTLLYIGEKDDLIPQRVSNLIKMEEDVVSFADLEKSCLSLKEEVEEVEEEAVQEETEEKDS